jgi:hypothetical protein
MSLKDKGVVVTGGSCGLGLGLVEALVAHCALTPDMPPTATRAYGFAMPNRIEHARLKAS